MNSAFYKEAETEIFVQSDVFNPRWPFLSGLSVWERVEVSNSDIFFLVKVPKSQECGYETFF